MPSPTKTHVLAELHELLHLKPEHRDGLVALRDEVLALPPAQMALSGMWTMSGESYRYGDAAHPAVVLAGSPAGLARGLSVRGYGSGWGNAPVYEGSRGADSGMEAVALAYDTSPVLVNAALTSVALTFLGASGDILLRDDPRLDISKTHAVVTARFTLVLGARRRVLSSR